MKCLLRSLAYIENDLSFHRIKTLIIKYDLQKYSFILWIVFS